MKSGQQIAKANTQLFNGWIAERDAANDWADYVRQGKLNRSEIARECGFALSVLRQNPAVKDVLQALEVRLEAAGILRPPRTNPEATSEAAAATERATDKRIMAAKSKAETRVKALEEQNAALRAEVRDLRERLRRFELIDGHLGRTGRLLPG